MITSALVQRLVAEQFPQWADRSVAPVEPQGHDNRTFRLGADLAVRLPSGPGYADAVAKEDRALPELAPHLAVAVPEVVATGRPGAGYPFPWSVRRWLPGTVLDGTRDVDQVRLGADLGRFLGELVAAPAGDGPPAGAHSHGRGLHPGIYDEQVRACLAALDGDLRSTCAAIWQDALATTWEHAPVWFHGDLAPGNVLLVDGRLSAVIDFGTCGTGDPACDLVIAWTGLDDAGRRAFRGAVDLDDGTWLRARGWALWKALITEPGSPPARPAAASPRAAPRRPPDVTSGGVRHPGGDDESHPAGSPAGLSDPPGTMSVWTPPP